MKLSNTKLNQKELKDLNSFLAEHSNFSLPALHGYLTAVASSPFVINPSEWVPLILAQPENSKNNKVSGLLDNYNVELLVKLYNHILKNLSYGKLTPLLSSNLKDKWPHFNESNLLRDWCKYYLVGTCFYHGEWIEEEKENELLKFSLFHFIMFLSEEDRKEIMGKDAGKIPQDMKKKIEKTKGEMEENLPNIINDLYNFWGEYSEEIEEGGFFDENHLPPLHDIGRNSVCFCGSGKKYKKCCLN